MILAGCQINPINVNFYLQKSLEIFVKKSMEKIWSKKDKEIKVCPPCHLGLIIMYDRSLKLHNFKLVSKEKYRLMPNVAAAQSWAASKQYRREPLWDHRGGVVAAAAARCTASCRR